MFDAGEKPFGESFAVVVYHPIAIVYRGKQHGRILLGDEPGSVCRAHRIFWQRNICPALGEHSTQQLWHEFCNQLKPQQCRVALGMLGQLTKSKRTL